MNPNEPFRPGLEDVVVEETALSLVDGVELAACSVRWRCA
jgi:hypothetical protein